MTSPIELAAQQHPNETAFDDGERTITFADLMSKLSTHPVSTHSKLCAGEHVAWCPRNDFDAFVTFWALQHQGCVACPISFRFPEKKRQEVVAQLGAKWLPDLLVGFDESQATKVRVSGHAPDQPSTIVLSSGSTGVPKAIVHSMSAHVASAEGAATNMPLNLGDRWLWSLPLFHISGLSVLVRCAVAGATVVAPPKSSEVDGSALGLMCVTHLSVVAIQLLRLLDDSSFPNSSLRYVLLGGSRVDPKLVAQARDRGVNVLTTYGLTEMASQVTTSKTDGDPSCSGQLLPGRKMKIDPETKEILVQGQTLCLGYYRDGQIHSSSNENGWFATKDFGQLHNGELKVLGRIDNMFVSGGENIHPENVERAMYAMFEVEQVVVVPKADPKFGARPVAFVKGVLPKDWQQFIRSQLKGFEVPVAILAWPGNAEGDVKVDRKFLQGLLKNSN